MPPVNNQLVSVKLGQHVSVSGSGFLHIVCKEIRSGL